MKRPPCDCEAGFWQDHCLNCGKRLIYDSRASVFTLCIVIVIALVCLAMLRWCVRDAKAACQDSHTGITAGTTYDALQGWCEP